MIAFLPQRRVIRFTQPIVPEFDARLAPATPLFGNNRVTLSKETPVAKIKNSKPTRKIPLFPRRTQQKTALINARICLLQLFLLSSPQPALLIRHRYGPLRQRLLSSLFSTLRRVLRATKPNAWRP